jgi:hypothetical protein
MCSITLASKRGGKLVRALALAVASVQFGDVARATTYVWDGDEGITIGGPAGAWNYWDATSLSRFVGWVGDPAVLPGVNDKVVFAQSYISGGDVEMRGNRAVGTLQFSGSTSTIGQLIDGRNNQESFLQVASGSILLADSAADTSVFELQSSVRLITSNAMTFSGDYGFLTIFSPIFAPSIEMRSSEVIFRGPITAPSFRVTSGKTTFASDSSITATELQIGDLSGQSARLTASSIDLTNKDFSINGNGQLNLAFFLQVDNVKMNGGSISGPTMRLNSFTGSPARIGSQVIPCDLDNISLDLGGDTVVFDINSAFGVQDAVSMQDSFSGALTNGTFDKQGDGNITLDLYKISLTAMNIREGGVINKSVPAAGSGSTACPITIGDASNLPAFYRSGADHTLRAGTSMTINQSGRWDVNGFSESLNGLAINGGTITGESTGLVVTRGSVSLTGTTTVGGNSQSTILADLQLPSTTVFDVSNGSAAVDLLLDDSISGGTLRKIGPGTLRMAGTPGALSPLVPNSHNTTLVEAGTLELTKPDGINAAGNLLWIGTTNGAAGSATAKWLANDQMPANGSILLDGGAVAQLNGKTQTIKSLSYIGSNASLTTAGGTLSVTDSINISSSSASFNGNLDLGGGTVSIVSGGTSVGLDMTGRATNGTIKKSGSGTLALNSVFGNALLDAQVGTTTLNGANLRGFQGSAPITVQGPTATTLNVPSGANYTYSGVLSGDGPVSQTGLGNINLTGSTANANTNVWGLFNGMLTLNKAAAVHSIVGDLNIASANATVDVLSNGQFSGTSDVSVLGKLQIHSTLQSLRSLSVSSGGSLVSDFGGQMFVLQGATFAGGTTTGNPMLGITAGGVHLSNGATPLFYGSVIGASDVDASSRLRIDGSSFPGSDITLRDLLSLQSGATIEMLLQTPGNSALIDCNGPLLVGSPLAPGGILTSMLGIAHIDLSQNGYLPLGVYNLIDFSGAPYTSSSSTGSIYATALNFDVLLPPSTLGTLSVTPGHVLQLTVVPEPTFAATIACLGMSMFRRKRR